MRCPITPLDPHGLAAVAALIRDSSNLSIPESEEAALGLMGVYFTAELTQGAVELTLSSKKGLVK